MIRTPEEAHAWCEHVGLNVEIYSDDLRVPIPPNAFIVMIEALRRQVEREPTPSIKIVPCPPEMRAAGRKALVLAIQSVRAEMFTLFRGARELDENADAQTLIDMAIDLDAMAARLNGGA